MDHSNHSALTGCILLRCFGHGVECTAATAGARASAVCASERSRMRADSGEEGRARITQCKSPRAVQPLRRADGGGGEYAKAMSPTPRAPAWCLRTYPIDPSLAYGPCSECPPRAYSRKCRAPCAHCGSGCAMPSALPTRASVSAREGIPFRAHAAAESAWLAEQWSRALQRADSREIRGHPSHAGGATKGVVQRYYMESNT